MFIEKFRNFEAEHVHFGVEISQKCIICVRCSMFLTKREEVDFFRKIRVSSIFQVIQENGKTNEKTLLGYRAAAN